MPSRITFSGNTAAFADLLRRGPTPKIRGRGQSPARKRGARSRRITRHSETGPILASRARNEERRRGRVGREFLADFEEDADGVFEGGVGGFGAACDIEAPGVVGESAGGDGRTRLSLNSIGRFGLLPQLLDTIAILPAVAVEFTWPCTFARTGSSWAMAREAGRQSVWDSGLRVRSDYRWLPNGGVVWPGAEFRRVFAGWNVVRSGEGGLTTRRRMPSCPTDQRRHNQEGEETRLKGACPA